MKKLLLGTLLLFCFTLPAWSANFVEINRGKDHSIHIHIDVDSIEMRTQGNDKYLVVWMKLIPKDEGARELKKEYRQPVDFIMELSAYNMERKQYQRLSVQAYDKKGQIIDSESREFNTSRYIEIASGSFGEEMYNFIMSRYKK